MQEASNFPKHLKPPYRLHLGCGDRYLNGWLNVDAYSEKADWKIDLREMDLEPYSVRECLCVHTIEHLDRDEGYELLKRLYRWLRIHAKLVLETPDRKKCIDVLTRHGFSDDTEDHKRRRKDFKQAELQVILACKGLAGGRSGSRSFKGEWESLLSRNRVRINARAFDRHFPVENGWCPSKFRQPGHSHRYVWSGPELSLVMQTIGYSQITYHKAPQFHGKNDWRDTRIEARKQ